MLEHIWSGTQRANVGLEFRNAYSPETNSQLRMYSLANEKRTGSQNVPRQNRCAPHYGLVNTEDKFIPDLTAKTYICKVLQYDNSFQMTDKHEQQWQKLLTTSLVLPFYVHNKNSVKQRMTLAQCD